MTAFFFFKVLLIWTNANFFHIFIRAHKSGLIALLIPSPLSVSILRPILMFVTDDKHISKSAKQLWIIHLFTKYLFVDVFHIEITARKMQR